VRIRRKRRRETALLLPSYCAKLTIRKLAVIMNRFLIHGVERTKPINPWMVTNRANTNQKINPE
jgi:hypothetical protein